MSEQARFASNAIDPTPSSSSAKRTPAQREKKRAQDRQSQRNVRNRTKQHIAYLEARVNELSSYKGLSHLISANETLQAQNAELISALRSIASLVEKVCESAAANAGVTTKKPVESRREPSSETTSSEYPEEALGQYGSPAESNGRRTSGVAAFANHKSDPRGVRTVSATSPRIPARSRNHSTAHVEAGIGLGSSTRVYPMHHAPLLETQAANGVFSPKDDWLPQSIVPSLGAEHDMLWEPSGLSNAQPLLPGNLFNHIASLPFDSSMTSNDHPQSTHLPQPSFIPESQICPPTNQWDTKLTAFILLHRSSVTAFGNKQTLEPSPANFDIFVYPERTSATSDPISHFLASAIIPWNFSLPERLAMAWLNHIFIKVSHAKKTPPCSRFEKRGCLLALLVNSGRSLRHPPTLNIYPSGSSPNHRSAKQAIRSTSTPSRGRRCAATLPSTTRCSSSRPGWCISATTSTYHGTAQLQRPT